MEASSPFSPNSPQALAIFNLFVLSLVISAVIFAIVTGLVIYILFRYRGRPGQAEPPQISGHTRLEIAWTAAPALLLVVMFALTVATMRAADPPRGEQQPDLEVIGHQWWWEVRYPKSGVVTANEIHIPTGRRLLVRLDSDDVIHDFWVPQLGPKRDMTPGHTTYIWIQADRPGTFEGACAEYCGQHHAWMRIRVIADEPAAFQAWEQQQAQPAPAPAAGEVAEGARIFRERTCVNCHVIQGQGGTAVGPDLTHVASRQTLGAGVIRENTPETLAEWVRNPQDIKPGSYMPDLQLPEEELRALVAYMATLK